MAVARAGLGALPTDDQAAPLQLDCDVPVNVDARELHLHDDVIPIHDDIGRGDETGASHPRPVRHTPGTTDDLVELSVQTSERGERIPQVGGHDFSLQSRFLSRSIPAPNRDRVMVVEPNRLRLMNDPGSNLGPGPVLVTRGRRLSAADPRHPVHRLDGGLSVGPARGGARSRETTPPPPGDVTARTSPDKHGRARLATVRPRN